jgi:hypothetical protein
MRARSSSIHAGQSHGAIQFEQCRLCITWKESRVHFIKGKAAEVVSLTLIPETQAKDVPDTDGTGWALRGLGPHFHQDWEALRLPRGEIFDFRPAQPVRHHERPTWGQ